VILSASKSASPAGERRRNVGGLFVLLKVKMQSGLDGVAGVFCGAG
jgi:hypothetical protein